MGEKPNIDDYIKQENYKRKHKFSTWLKSCIVKPFPTWSDDDGEIMCIVVGLILGGLLEYMLSVQTLNGGFVVFL